MQDDAPGSQPRKQVKTDESELTQLKKHSLVVADTGDFNQLEKYKPEDSTTNPTLILQAAQLPEFSKFIDESIEFGLNNYNKYEGPSKRRKTEEPAPVKWQELSEEQQTGLIELVYDHLFVTFGCNILKKVPGYVSTEVDAKLSFDKDQTMKRARRIINLYEDSGVSKDRILIKIASTWEGIQAAKALLKDKIKCNMTLIFHKIQAIACAQNKLFLISPFVGRILDWYKNDTKKNYENPTEDPGVVSVTEIYHYFKKHGHQTVIMGASFRNTGQIKELCGCDRLTIAPKLLGQLQESNGPVPVKLTAEKSNELDIERIHVNEVVFRYEMNKSKMATDLLSAGIRKFEEDGDKLKEMIREKFTKA